MKLVDCTRCGSKELYEQDGLIVCGYCRSRFVPQPEDRVAPETVIGLAADVQALLLKCRDDPANRRRYASLILDIDPSNYEAQQYLT